MGWKGRRENLIEMPVTCRVIRILKALLTLQARCNLITAGFSISVLRLSSLLQASDSSCESEASYCTSLVSFYGKMQVHGTVMSYVPLQVYGTAMSVCTNAGSWYRNVRMCHCRFMVPQCPYVPMQVHGTVMSLCANADLWYPNVRMCHCMFMVP